MCIFAVVSGPATDISWNPSPQLDVSHDERLKSRIAENRRTTKTIRTLPSVSSVNTNK